MISLLILLILLLFIGGGIWGWPLLAGILGIASVSDKPGAVKHIVQLIRRYDISSEEIATALAQSATDGLATPRRKKAEIAKALFTYLGAIFIFSGVATYIGMFWDSMGSVMRVMVTLGVSYCLLIVLVSALHEGKFPKLVVPLAIVCALMMTSGWFVAIAEVFPQVDNWRTATLSVFALMAIHQGVLLAKYQRTVLVFTSLVFIYGFMQVGLDILAIRSDYTAIGLGASLFLVAAALDKTDHRSLSEAALLIGCCWFNSGIFIYLTSFSFVNWATVITGTCVMFAAYGIDKAGSYHRLATLGYFIGSIIAYTGLFDLLQNTPVEILYLLITAIVLYFCLVLQSRALLLTTIVAMLLFIGYFSAQYFVNSLGWPITLILMGVAFLGVGSIALKLKQRIQTS